MKFVCSVDINAPIDIVVEMFENPNNLVHWQDGFLGMQHLEGMEGEPGSVTRMTYQIGSKNIDLIEILEVNNLPEEFRATYDSESTFNVMKVNFTDLGNGYTRYTTYVEYIKMRGFFLNIIGRLLPIIFEKQTQKWCNQFRDFVESEVNKSSW